MKIAVIGTRGLPAKYGGFETCADHVSKHWVENGHEVLVYCRKTFYKDRPDRYNGVRLKYVNPIDVRSLDTLVCTFLCCINLIFSESEIKYIHLYNGGNGIFLPLLKLFGKKIIISVDAIEWKRQKWGWLAKSMHKIGEQFTIWFADEVITDNKVVENYYRKKYNISPMTIPYGSKIISQNTSWVQILKNFQLTAKQYFIFVGRLVPEKGVHKLINVYNRLNTEMPLIIIGDDHNDSNYKKDLLKFESKNVRFMGFIYGSKYEALLANACLYVSASELEGTSPSLLAAMGAKVCVLINGIDENLYTINDNGMPAGYYFKQNDMEDFEKKWDMLIKNPLMIEEMGVKGFNLVQKRYKWENIADEYIATFKKL